MCKKTISLISLLLVVALAGSVSAELVGQWKLDDGGGTTATDASGNGNHGTLEDDPEVVDGQFGQALAFDGSRVAIPASDSLSADLFQGSFTLSAWINPTRTGNTWQQIFRAMKEDGTSNDTLFINNDGRLSWRGRVNAAWAGGMCETAGNVVPAGQWTHVAVTGDGTNFRIYVNGALSQESAFQTTDGTNAIYYIGGNPAGTSESYAGMVDDLRVYNHVLSADDIASSMLNQGGAIVKAYGPEPRDGSMLEATWVSMSWRAGDLAVSHDVYMGDNFADVNSGAADTFQGNLATTTLIAGFVGFPFPDGLVPGTTYYWRVDQVNPDDPNSPWKGDIWSFWVPPRTAYDPSPADDGKYVATDIELSWTKGFGAQLHTVYFGENFDDVNNATGGPAQTTATHAPGPLAVDTVYYWRVDEFQAPLTHKGSVWSFRTLPDVAVTNPNLMLWWTLDEGEGKTAVDWSGHGNHGTIVGDAEWVDGYQGTALTFGDDVYVEAAGYDGVTGTAPRTCCAWIRTSTANRNIMSWGQNVAGQKWRMRIDGTGGLRAEVNGGYHYGVTNIADGQWHHVAVTFEDDGSPDALDTFLYVDGQQDATAASLDEPIDTGAGPVRIGESPWHNAPFLDEIDDARIYDKVLTAEEIQQAMLGNTSLAGNPAPDRGALVDMRDISSLNWSAGDAAVSHDVYFGTDRDVVAGADSGSPQFQGNQAGTSLSLAGLVEFGGGDYYWRVDEIAADGTAVRGTIWKFTVPDYLIVDNFESYDNIDPAPGEPGLNRIFDKWIDGFGTTTNGALVGNDLPPYAETSIVHGGAQSMIYRYDNAGKTSEASLTLAKNDWTVEAVTKLSLWFRGASANAADRVYVALNGNALVYHDDPAATQIAGWKEWVVDLTAFGTDLTKVSSITIGIGTRNAPAAGGTGTMYFDDIGLYR